MRSLKPYQGSVSLAEAVTFIAWRRCYKCADLRRFMWTRPKAMRRLKLPTGPIALLPALQTALDNAGTWLAERIASGKIKAWGNFCSGDNAGEGHTTQISEQFLRQGIYCEARNDTVYVEWMESSGVPKDHHIKDRYRKVRVDVEALENCLATAAPVRKTEANVEAAKDSIAPATSSAISREKPVPEKDLKKFLSGLADQLAGCEPPGQKQIVKSVKAHFSEQSISRARIVDAIKADSRLYRATQGRRTPKAIGPN